MKQMTINEVRTICGGHGSRSTYLAAQLVREFVKLGYEAIEVEPEDLGREWKPEERAKVQGVRQTLQGQIHGLNLDGMVEVRTNAGHIFLIRKDM